MSKLRKVNYKLILWICLFKAIHHASFAWPIANQYTFSAIPVFDSIPIKDSLPAKTDTLNFKIAKDSVDAPVNYEAEDSVIVDLKSEKIYLYKKGLIGYKEIKLESAIIQVDQRSQILTAYPELDSLKRQSGTPTFKQGDKVFTSDTIKYNFKTERGVTIGTYTQEGEMFVYGTRVKRINADTYYAGKARFTSCNFDTPHFAFRARRVKMISNKVAVTGFVRPEFEGVPIPVGLPYGLFPLKQGRRTGLIVPQFTVNEQLGLGLEGLGYYKVFGDYWDAMARANIYSYGSWNLFVNPNYRKRYRYNGSFNFSYLNNKFGFEGDPDFIPPSRNFGLQWNHAVDGKARPGQNFSASVNIATSLFNQFFPNNAQQNFNNTLTSSISYQKMWASKPYNLSINANHNQNSLNRLYNVNLPDVGFTVNTIYPFQQKNFVGASKWYEKLGIGYNGNFRNQFAFYDTALSMRQLLDTFQWGARHSIPIQLSLPAVGPLQIGPAISFEEVWYQQSFVRSWNSAEKKMDTIINKGFYRGNQMSFGVNLSTALFGTMNFKKTGSIQAIRHVIRPTIGVSYKPDLAKNQWYETQIDSLGNRLRFNKFEGSVFGGLSEGEAGFVSFTLDNNLEMKVKNKKDTGDGGVKKIRIIDGFGMNTGYNLLADSFALSDFNFYLRSNILEFINLTANATVSPYKQDDFGRRLRQYAWEGGKFSPGRFVNGFIAVNANFKSKPKDENKQKEKETYLRERSQSFDEFNRQVDMVQQNPAEYADFNIPWSVNFSYALNLSRQIKPDYSGFTTQITQSLNFGGDFNLTEKWKMQAQGAYDFVTRQIQYLTASVSRDMHCWQMSLNITPVGLFRSFNITISPKSSILRDLRINRSRVFYNLPQ
ncbi:MAG: putative LPS assembly protein LptD [Bacteroidota bacterium]